MTHHSSVSDRDKYQVTEWARPDETMGDTQWDRMSYAVWLTMEIARWEEKDGSEGQVWIERGNGIYDGYVALFAYRRADMQENVPEPEDQP